MKKVCVKWLALSLAVLLLCGTAVGCNDNKGPSDAERYAQAQAAMEQGDYAQAYLLLRDVKNTAENADAIALRDKLVFIPTKVTENNSDGSYVTTIEYDGLGKILRRNMEMPKDVRGEAVYSYDANGNRLQKDYIRTDKETMASVIRVYNDKNQIVSQKKIELTGTVIQETFTYDENGNCTERTKISSTGADKQYVYEYYANGTVKTEKVYDVVADQLHLLDETAYTYDGDGREIMSMTVRYGKETLSIIKREYDDAGNEIKYEGFYKSGTYDRIICTWDEYGNELSYKYLTGKFNDNFEPYNLSTTVQLTSEYTYDEYGNILTATYSSGSTMTYEWQLFYYPDGIPEDVADMKNALERNYIDMW